MSNRERWILYPLLILALALGAKAVMGPSETVFNAVSCQRLQCNEMELIDPVSKRRIVRMGLDPADREAKIVLFDDGAQPAVTLSVAGDKKIGTLDAEIVRVRHPESHKRIVELGAGEKLGQLTFYGDDDTKAMVTLGAGEQGAVLQSLRAGKSQSWPGESTPPAPTPATEKPTTEKPATESKPQPPTPPEE